MKKSLLLLSVFSLLTNVASAKNISLRDIPELITNTYVFAIIFVAVFLLLAIIISNIIAIEGGSNPKDPGKRKMWFWIFAILGPISVYLYNFIMVIPNIRPGPAEAAFGSTNLIATLIVLVSYILIGFILSKTMKRGKIGNWFPSKDK